jgi:head-tail adaptor
MTGRLRERVSLQRRDLVNDGGAATTTYVTAAPTRVPAHVSSPLGVSVEQQVGGQLVPVISHMVTLRRWPAVRLQDRLLWHRDDGDRTLEVRGIAYPDEPRRRWMQLACEAREL